MGGRLSDIDTTAGSAPAFSPEALLAELDTLGLGYRLHEHRAVFTAEEAQRECGDLPGAHIKNLFLRNKKGRMWIVTFLAHRHLDLRALGQAIGAGRLSFASPERMLRTLGVTPGAVTPLGVVNDGGREVEVVLDSAIFESELVNVHPLVNTMTVGLRPDDLVRFLCEVEHPAQVVDLEPLTVAPAGTC